MKIFRSLDEAAAARAGPRAVAIGNFDGVHLGHQGLFASVRAAAAALGGRAIALTFEPHPARLLSPALAPRLLTTPERKLELLAAAGLDEAVVQSFDDRFAALTADAFVDAYLLAGLGARAVAVGPDFSFGKGRAGSIETLRAGLAAAGATLAVVPKIEIDGVPVSSTRIRELVLEGRVTAAARLLGRPYDLDGLVVTGMGRGRTIGWPTANVVPAGELLPASGVYAVRATTPHGEFAGAANLGRKPTFGSGADLTVEVHLIDYPGENLVGAALRVRFLERLRAEMRFPSIEALSTQIGQDVEAARRLAG